MSTMLDVVEFMDENRAVRASPGRLAFAPIIEELAGKTIAKPLRRIVKCPCGDCDGLTGKEIISSREEYDRPDLQDAVLERFAALLLVTGGPGSIDKRQAFWADRRRFWAASDTVDRERFIVAGL